MWIRTSKSVSKDCTTITYTLNGTDLKVESRKKKIPHANRNGAWDHTTYFVLQSGKEIKELWTLKAAKEYAEGRV